MDRDRVVEVFDRLQERGLAYLSLLILLNGTTVAELQVITHSDRETIGNALKSLEVRHFAIRVQFGHAFKWFPSESALSFMRSPTVGIPDSKAPSSSSSSDIKLLAKAEEEEREQRSVGIPDSKAAVLARVLKKLEESRPDLVQSFRESGIGRNMWLELEALEHVNAEYIKQHDLYRRSRNEPVGYLIQRVRSGDEVPEVIALDRNGESNSGLAWVRDLEKIRGKRGEKPKKKTK